ncbi:MAG: hypothetical protein DMF67_12720 [Acidobacteria bacterium]|nr:MAG: hypothetical protein DMF66_17380 [Acidobacteriota bacterium]PYS82526.1 MAG: hypothetical protein DMF67_12720 [Acidobacteriota bacterium]
MPMQMVGQVPDELRVKLSVWLTLFSLTAVSFALMYAGALLVSGAIYSLAEALTGYAFRVETLDSINSWAGVGCFATGVFVFACLVRGSLETKRRRA